jgi:phosphoglycolate phosphatase
VAKPRSVKPRAVVFDLDGTLIDSRKDIALAVNHVLRAHGLAELDVAQIASYVGDGARWLVARSARLDYGDASVDELLAEFLEYYTRHATDHTRLVPGAREVLDALAYLPLALCTNKPRRTTEATLSALGLDRVFRVVTAGGDLPHRKPEPEPLYFIARELAVEPADLVMVGDAPQDIECARAAGARSVGVEDGIAPREQLVGARPDALIQLAELPALIQSWRR